MAAYAHLNSPLLAELPCPQVYFHGHTGTRKDMMGVYELSAQRKANGAPVFVKRLEGGGQHFLYRDSHGKWAAADEESHLAKDMGWLASSEVADLPSEEGLRWNCYEGEWMNEPGVSCCPVRSPFRSCFH